MMVAVATLERPPTAAEFEPLSWQVDPWRDTSITLLLTGSAGGGKSRLAGEKVHAFMLEYPGATGVIGRKDKTSANKSVVPLMRHTVQGGTDWGRFLKTDGLFEYDNGSHLWVVGLKDEGQRENLRSIGVDGKVDIAWFEEANKLSQEDDNEIKARMRGTAADWRQIIYTTNPDYPGHWIKKRLIDGGEASPYFSGAIDNPYNPPEYLDLLRTLTGVHYDRLCLGKWVQAEGAVYSEYQVSKHLRKRKEPSGDDRFIVSIDFGFTNPFSASLWHVDNDDKMYLFKQIYFTQRLVEDHAENIRKMTAGYRIEAYVCDHDAEGRATLEKHLGIQTKLAYKAVSEGIEAVKSRIKNDRLFIMQGALEELDMELEKNKKPTCTADEISGYRWSDKKQDTPIKEDDHGLDEMRYAVCYIDKIGAKGGAARIGVRASNWSRADRKRKERS